MGWGVVVRRAVGVENYSQDLEAKTTTTTTTKDHHHLPMDVLGPAVIRVLLCREANKVVTTSFVSLVLISVCLWLIA